MEEVMAALRKNQNDLDEQKTTIIKNADEITEKNPLWACWTPALATFSLRLFKRLQSAFTQTAFEVKIVVPEYCGDANVRHCLSRNGSNRHAD
ncbi:hypothetical protein EVAR_96847_1 [Eumeta japonica]|uniref:Uncharacterized protein n=1 Tax=Eumeta variegata TaxID=151549 RepID=A0A4C1TPE5_EUMVA|nr:hypothetical protein EVAR_96847_1 [Eumeta japonica]